MIYQIGKITNLAMETQNQRDEGAEAVNGDERERERERERESFPIGDGDGEMGEAQCDGVRD